MICISITHKNLTAAKRECFACNDEEQIKLAGAVAKTYPEAGLVLLMTCNRSENLYERHGHGFRMAGTAVCGYKEIPGRGVEGCGYAV